MFSKEAAMSPQISVERPKSGMIGLLEGRLPRRSRQQVVGSKCRVEAIIAEDSRSCLNRGSMLLFQWVQLVSMLGQGEGM